VPAAQFAHALEPAEEYVPTAQEAQFIVPEADAYIPAPQLTHRAVMPGEYMPATQDLQLELPLAAW